MPGTKSQENQNETPTTNFQFHFDRVPMDQTPFSLDQNVGNDPLDERARESADDQSVDWQKKYEDSERVNQQLRNKMKTMAARFNNKMKNLKIEKNRINKKFFDLIGKYFGDNDVGDFMMVTDFRCRWQNHYVGDFFRYVGDFLNVLNRSPTS